MSDADTVGSLAAEVASAFRPLADAFASPQGFAAFMESLGWAMNAVPPALSPLGDAAGRFAALLAEGQSEPNVADLLAAIASFAGAVSGIASQPNGNFPPGLDVAGFKAEFPQQLLDALVVDYLADRIGGWGALLKLAGVTRFEEVPAAAGRPAFIRRSVAWADLGNFFSAPAAIPQNAYLWGQAGFRDEQLVGYLADALGAWNLNYRFAAIDPALFGSLTAGALDPDKVFPTALQLPFFEELTSGVGGAVGLELLILPQTAAKFGGFAVVPYAEGNLTQDIPLNDALVIQVRGRVQTGGAIALVFRPGDPVALSTGEPAVSAAFSIGVVTRSSDGQKTVLLGTPDASRLEYGSLGLLAGARAEGAAISFFGEVDLNNASLVISPGADADGFLAKLLPSSLSADLSLTLGLDTHSGFYFGGSGGLEVQLPVHISIGPIDVLSATISVRPSGNAVPIDLGASMRGSLGPLQAVVENIGLSIPFTFRGQGGNLGPLDVSLKFKPPNGVGLSIDAGVVSGGGFLSIDTDRGQYAGVLQLTIADFLSVTAIGLIETKMPDGSNGFSLLIIITADFGAGIQLGFGFTLLAVGGLLGLNRGMLFQPIMDGVRTNAISSVMFPQDVIANAPRIISDLQAFFPAQEGTFLIGPMAKIGWGEPTLVSLSLGVIIEIPPGDIAILGVLKLALPADDLAILVLQVNFAGAIEVDKQRIYFFASLFDSHILFITIDGSMGLLVAYGEDANFVVSVGGFHPQFKPPPLPFPVPQRISVNIINEDYARIHCDGYFAVTTNTVQFGTHSDYFFGFSALSVEGDSSFDALIQFSPFHFTVSISTSFSVHVFGAGVFGVGISLTLEGPTPWHANGTASISLLFFSIDVNIDFTWGDSRDTTLPPVAVMPLLTAELGKQSNWRTLLPQGSNLLVSLRQLDPSETDQVLHPVGTLRVSQRLVPFDITLDKFGNQRPTDANHFTLSVASPAFAKTRDLPEQFAPAQFKNMDDAAKLSQPAYVPMDGGIELGAGGATYASATAITRVVRYDVKIVDTRLRFSRIKFYLLAAGLFQSLLRGGSVARSPFSAWRKAQVKPYADSVVVSPETFGVALKSDNTAFHPDATGFTSQVAANEYLARTVTAKPELTGALHVLPQFEMAA